MTELGGTYFVVVARHRRRGLRVPARAEQVGAGLPRDRGRRRDHPHQHGQGDPRPRPPQFNPIAETLGPSFPSGHSGLAAAFYAAAALVLARKRSPRTRALLAGGAVAIAVGVACSRVLLGVHWMSDVIAGLAFGWAWFGICAIAFGGRFLVLGAPVEQAAEIAEERGVRPPSGQGDSRSDVVEPALQRADQAAPTPRDPGKLHEAVRQSLAALEELELLRRDALPVLVDQLDRIDVRDLLGRSSRCSDHSRSRAARAMRPGRASRRSSRCRGRASARSGSPSRG